MGFEDEMTGRRFIGERAGPASAIVEHIPIVRSDLEKNLPYPVSWDQKYSATRDIVRAMHVYHLTELEKLWRDENGVYVTEDGALKLNEGSGSILRADTLEHVLEPYATILALMSNHKKMLERAENGTLWDGYIGGKMPSHKKAKIHPNSFFHSTGTGNSALSTDSLYEFILNADKIIAFYKSLRKI